MVEAASSVCEVLQRRSAARELCHHELLRLQQDPQEARQAHRLQHQRCFHAQCHECPELHPLSLPPRAPEAVGAAVRRDPRDGQVSRRDVTHNKSNCNNLYLPLG